MSNTILKPIAFTSVEGGKWYVWTEENITQERIDNISLGKERIVLNLGNCRKHVHAIKFADGRVWDCINGWREPSE